VKSMAARRKAPPAGGKPGTIGKKKRTWERNRGGQDEKISLNVKG